MIFKRDNRLLPNTVPQSSKPFEISKFYADYLKYYK